MDDDSKTALLQAAVREGAKAAFQTGAEVVGAQMVAREAIKYTATVASQKGAEAGVSVATAQAAARYATSMATAGALAKAAGPAAGVVAGPIVEVIALARDGEEHSRAEYTEAGMRGLASGAASVAAGAVAGSVVAGPPGVAIGWRSSWRRRGRCARGLGGAHAGHSDSEDRMGRDRRRLADG
ncbi:hypothetical protein ABZ543_12080 [Streptomyces roseifaciens]